MYRICKTRPWTSFQDPYAFEFHRLHIPEPTAAITSKGIEKKCPTHTHTQREMASSDSKNDVEVYVGAWQFVENHLGA